MLADDDRVESMDFFAQQESDDDILSMPCFEVSNADDRPVAPSAEDYPLGCEVELRDVEFARVAQESGHWEPFMEEVFSVPRRRVKVWRHEGDYTFVICTDIHELEVVGLTLYRACLSEPKVKTTKYYANVAQGVDDEEQLASHHSDTQRSAESHADDMFSRPVGPGTAAETLLGQDAPGRQRPPLVGTDDCTEEDPLLANPQGGRHPSTNVGQVRRRNKFAAAMKRGTKELENHNYDKALLYYNAALAEAPEEEARALSSRSVAYLLLRQTENALNDAKRVIELNPDSYLGYVRAGNVLRGMKQYGDAQAYYKDALRHDTSNPIIRKLLLENSVAMLYDARVKRFPKIKIVFDSSRIRVQAVSRQQLRQDEIALKETTPLMSIVSSRPVRVMSGVPSSRLCHNCGRPFLDEAEICSHIPGLRPELFRSLYNEPEPVRCNYECHAMYCSEECRSKSWAFHHWVECGVRGRWRQGVNAVHQYLDEYISSTPFPSYTDPSTAPANAVVDMSPLVIASAARVALRMFSRMLSCVWSLKDAVHMFDWLRVSPEVEGQRAAVRPVLRECYHLLSSSFFGEECAKFTYELFVRCYERVKSNAVLLQVSAWSKMLFRAETHITLVESEGSSTSQRTSTTALMGSASAEGQHKCLQHILNAPLVGVPGAYFTCLAVFELYAAMEPVDGLTERHRAPVQQRPSTHRSGVTPRSVTSLPNVELQGLIEPQVCIHIRATSSIAKGDMLVSVEPAYPPYWLTETN